MSTVPGNKRTRTGQFAKGRSGNPSGRPKKQASTKSSVFDVVLDREVNGVLQGNTTALSVEEALQQQTLKDAFAGKRMAQRRVLKMIEKRDAFLAKHSENQPGYKIETVYETDPDNANAALRILGIACDDPQDYGPNGEYDRLLLEPWAVQAALSRRRGGAKFEDDEVRDITRCTRDPDRLRWPRGTGQ